VHQVLLLGAGKIGRTIADFLGQCGDYHVHVGDVHEPTLERVRQRTAHTGRVSTQLIDVEDPAAIRAAMSGRHTVISALSFSHNRRVAEAALESGLSYFDLTEDVETTRRVKALAAGARAGQVFMPQCGLAPGFVSIVTAELCRQFETQDHVIMRVGALPLYPSNAMKYNLTWSTDGLINEYCNLCEAIVDGRLMNVLPLEGRENFSLDGVEYEVFNTSGGLGTLCETLAGQVRSLNYKTIRYQGHHQLMCFLVNELRMNERRGMLKEILESAVPVTYQDVVVVFCAVTGKRHGDLVQIADARKVYHGHVMGRHRSAIQITTAAGVCAVLDLFVAGKLVPREFRGFVRQEQVRLADFLGNRFGKLYDGGQAGHSVRTTSDISGVGHAAQQLAQTGS
jgi:saccharopine dehydrogenase-like NADP-dependent oxidoreductase